MARRAPGAELAVRRLSGPGDLTGSVDEASAAGPRPLGGEADDGVRAFGDGLGAAVAVEIGRRVAGIGGVDADAR